MKQAAARTTKRAKAKPSRPQRPTRAPKFVYSFASGKAEGSSALRPLLGGKGSELAEMTNLGVPVPPGFTITTEAWAAYHGAGYYLRYLEKGPGLAYRVYAARSRT